MQHEKQANTISKIDCGNYKYINIHTRSLFMGVNFSVFFKQGTDESVWFFSGVLLLVMATFVTEPYFTAPTDTLANSISMGLMLFAIQNRDDFICFWPLMIYAFSMFVVSITSIIVRGRYPKLNRILYLITSNIGSSKSMYSAVYILSAFSYFKANNVKLIAALFLWIFIICLDVTGKAIVYINRFIKITKTYKDDADIGSAVKCTNPNLYTAEILKSKKNLSVFFNDKVDQLVMILINEESYQIGIVTTCKVLVDKLWIEMMLLKDNDGFIQVPANTITKDGNQVLLRKEIGSVRLISPQDLTEDQNTRISSAKQYRERTSLAGFILENSNINVIHFSILPRAMGCIAAGTVVTASINDKRILFQVFDGVTAQTRSDGDSSSGYIYAIARKIGHYNYSEAELESDKWLPNMNEPVYLMSCNNPNRATLKAIAENSVGFLPGTDMRIPLVDINALVTHNTAILGILGIGKSCLSFELITRMVMAGIKVICIDITNQYSSTESGLSMYITGDQLINEIPEEAMESVDPRDHQGSDTSEEDWGNINSFSSAMEQYIEDFCNAATPVLIINPYKYDITKGKKLGYKIDVTDVGIVGITKIITTAAFKHYSSLTLTDNARCCIVFEEAHSLIPEWSSAVEEGDSSYCNGTARVILQGRKYGLGCLAITQRTANISKSILNQCNTMFAMRAFDDTSKTFLENYIGKDYVNILPQLEERQAIVIGRGLKLKQPVIVQLNDKEFVQTQEPEQ